MAINTPFVYEQDTGASQIADSPFEYKEILFETEAGTDDGNIFTLNLSDYGITTFKTIRGWVHSPNDANQIQDEAPTTSVAAGVLSITVGGDADNLKRVYLIGGI